MVPTQRLLVVDREKRIVDLIETHLSREGYMVYKAYSAEEASGIYSMLKLTLIIMEESLIKSFKEKSLVIKNYDISAPVIALKEGNYEEYSQEDSEDKDGYIIKPFIPRLLVAKVNSIIKNIEDKKKDIQQILTYNGDELYIDFNAKLVKKRGYKVNLTLTEYRILKLLATNPNKVFSREEILELVMKDGYDGYDRVIDSHIKNLRSKIEENSKNPKYIVTIHKLGYKFLGA